MTQPTRKLNLLKNLRENWRDVVMALGAAFVLSFLNDQVQVYAGTHAGWTWLSNITELLSGIATFYLVIACAWIGLAVFSPDLNVFMVSSDYEAGYQELTHKQKFLLLMGLISVLTIAAAICLS